MPCREVCCMNVTYVGSYWVGSSEKLIDQKDIKKATDDLLVLFLLDRKITVCIGLERWPERRYPEEETLYPEIG